MHKPASAFEGIVVCDLPPPPAPPPRSPAPGAMDMALGLRTMVIPDSREDTLYKYNAPGLGGAPRREWSVHIQVGVLPFLND